MTSPDLSPAVREKVEPSIYGPELQLDPSNEIDGLLLNFKRTTQEDDLPSLAEQKSLITNMRFGDKEAKTAFLRQNSGYVAFVAHHYKANNLDDRQLLKVSGNALIWAAMSYRKRHGELDDYLLLTMFESMDTAFEQHVTYRLPRHGRLADYMFNRLESAKAVSTDLVESPRRRNLNRDKLAILAERLDVDSITDIDVDQLLSQLTDTQQQAIREYYFSGSNVRLEDVAQQLGGTKERIYDAQVRGLAKARRILSGSRQEVGKTKMERLRNDAGLVGVSGEAFEAALTYAPPRSRRVIEAYYFASEDTTWKQIGEQFDLAEFTVRQLAQAGIQKIREVYAPERPVSGSVYGRTDRLAKFAARLGINDIGNLEDVDMAQLLATATSKQRGYIEDYYFSEEELAWSDIAARYDTTVKNVTMSAMKAFAKMRSKLAED